MGLLVLFGSRKLGSGWTSDGPGAGYFVRPTVVANPSCKPLTLVREEMCRILRKAGFSVADGPEVETEYYCFDALNTPPDYPARAEQVAHRTPYDLVRKMRASVCLLGSLVGRLRQVDARVVQRGSRRRFGESLAQHRRQPRAQTVGNVELERRRRRLGDEH